MHAPLTKENRIQVVGRHFNGSLIFARWQENKKVRNMRFRLLTNIGDDGDNLLWLIVSLFRRSQSAEAKRNLRYAQRERGGVGDFCLVTS